MFRACQHLLSNVDRKEQGKKKKVKRLGPLFKRSAPGGQTSTANRSGSRPQNKKIQPLCVLPPLVHLSLTKEKVKKNKTLPRCVQSCSFPSSLHLVLWLSCFITISRTKIEKDQHQDQYVLACADGCFLKSHCCA